MAPYNEDYRIFMVFGIYFGVNGKYLIPRPQIRRTSRAGVTALMGAARSGHLEAVRVLLKAGAVTGLVEGRGIGVYPDPKRLLKSDPLEPYGKLYKDYIGVIKGLYRGYNFQILLGVWVGLGITGSMLAILLTLFGVWGS